VDEQLRGRAAPAGRRAAARRREPEVRESARVDASDEPRRDARRAPRAGERPGAEHDPPEGLSAKIDRARATSVQARAEEAHLCTTRLERAETRAEISRPLHFDSVEERRPAGGDLVAFEDESVLAPSGAKGSRAVRFRRAERSRDDGGAGA